MSTDSRACKKYVEIPLSGGDEKLGDMYMAMNTAR